MDAEFSRVGLCMCGLVMRSLGEEKGGLEEGQ